MNKIKKWQRTEDLPILPEDAEVIRVGTWTICNSCGEKRIHHEAFAYPSGLGVVHKACLDDLGRQVYFHL